MMNRGLHLPPVKGVRLENIRLDLPFDQAAARFAGDKGTVVLLSGSHQDCARFHILGAWPWLTLSSCQDRVCLEIGDDIHRTAKDPFDLLSWVMDQCCLKDIPGNLPMAGGLLGYFAYDLKDQIETLPRTCASTGLPDMLLYAPSVLLVRDRLDDTTTLCMPVFEGEDDDTRTCDLRSRFMERLAQPWQDGGFFVDERGLTSCFTKAEYIRAVKQIIAHLKAGDIYQANLSQQFETRFKGDAYGLFVELFNRNPAAFFSYINAGNHVVVSTSPERFVQLSGHRVETRPIKGTLARGQDPESDRENGERLKNSSKDDAELTMIVDLMRNDLSRVAAADSVVVTEHKRLEPYDNVFHLVSRVQGDLMPGKTAVDLIRATFPGGSITGCPKIRAMAVIDELEPVRRHVYTGSIGYLSFHGTMDLSIAIRTAIIRDDCLVFSVGGGIVFDSDPEKEFQETLDKGKTLMDTLRQAAKGWIDPPRKAWLDGKLVDEDRTAVSAAGPAVQYGAGLFETIRVEKGRALFLADHVRRMETAWQALFAPGCSHGDRLRCTRGDNAWPDITWADVIDTLVRENHLAGDVCAVKLICSPGNRPGQGMAAAFIRPYTHRLKTLGTAGLDLAVFPEPRQSFLADHKTLNYLVYDRAGAWARAQGAHEALIMNPDDTVSETNTANIFAVDKKTLILPVSCHVLAGVTLKRLTAAMENEGFRVVKQAMTWQALADLPNVLVSNALMGVVRVTRINGTRICHTPGICREMNRLLATDLTGKGAL